MTDDGYVTAGRLAVWAVAAFVAFYVLTSPDNAADAARGLIGGLTAAGESLARFAEAVSTG